MLSQRPVQPTYQKSELKTRFFGVFVEHAHGLRRELTEVLAGGVQLAQDIHGDRDDVAANRIRLEDIEQLARAGRSLHG